MKPRSLHRDRIKQYTVSTIIRDANRPEYGYETMIFDRTRTGNFTQSVGFQCYCRYYGTIEEAVKGHKDVVEKIEEGWTP